MINFYVSMIKSKILTIEHVPLGLRDEVSKQLGD